VWSFKKYTDAGWTWQRQSVRGLIVGQSLYYFDDLDACKLDAQRYGYSLDQPATVLAPDSGDDRPGSRDEPPRYREEHLSFREKMLQGRPY